MGWLATDFRMRGPTPRRGGHPVLVWAASVLAGAGFGAASSMANAFGSPYGPFTAASGEGSGWLQFLSTWLGSMWAWALFPFLIGWIVLRPGRAVLGGTAGLVAAVVIYYVCDAALGMTAEVEINAMATWVVPAAFGAPIMALIGSYARGTGLEHLLAALVAPGMMTYDVRRGGPSSGPVQPWSAWGVLSVAGVLTAIFFARFLIHWRSRLGSGHKREPRADQT